MLNMVDMLYVNNEMMGELSNEEREEWLEVISDFDVIDSSWDDVYRNVNESLEYEGGLEIYDEWCDVVECKKWLSGVKRRWNRFNKVEGNKYKLMSFGEDDWIVFCLVEK